MKNKEPRLDFSKYIGTYTVSETKKVIKDMKKDIKKAKRKFTK